MRIFLVQASGLFLFCGYLFFLSMKIIIFWAYKYEVDVHVNVVRHNSLVFVLPLFFAEFLLLGDQRPLAPTSSLLLGMLVSPNAVGASFYEDLALITPINFVLRLAGIIIE